MKLKKLFFGLASAILLAVALSSCSNSAVNKSGHSGVEYYRQLQFSETPYDIEKGTHALTPAEAADVNSYKFTYDNSGRLLSVEYVRNNVLLNYGSLQGAAKITYDYDGNKQVKHFYDKDNNQVEAGGVYAVEYSLDANGRRTGSMFLAKDGSMIENRNKIHSYMWQVLPDGMVRELRYNLKGEETVMNPFCPFYELRFTYNDKGYTTRMANFKADTLYNCTAENCGDIGVSYFTFNSNDKGDLEGFSVFNVTGQMSNLYWGWSKRLSKYDENGNVVETTLFDQDNEYVGGKLVPVTRNKYDSHGALVEVQNLDKDGNLINAADNGVAITEYKYDDKGSRTETITYDKNRVVVKI
jgi:YD repeat-containing protein